MIAVFKFFSLNNTAAKIGTIFIDAHFQKPDLNTTFSNKELHPGTSIQVFNVTHKKRNLDQTIYIVSSTAFKREVRALGVIGRGSGRAVLALNCLNS